MSREELPDEVCEIAETFIERVDFPYHEVAEGTYLFDDASSFWRRLTSMWNERIKLANIWPYRKANYAREAKRRLESEDVDDAFDWLDLKLDVASFRLADIDTEIHRIDQQTVDEAADAIADDTDDDDDDHDPQTTLI